MMRYILLLITIALASCAGSKYNAIKSKYERVVDMMFVSGQKNSKDLVYSIEREYSNANMFVLKHDGNVFFRGDYSDNEYIFEGFQKKYIFITPLPKRHQLSSPFLADRDSVFLYDLQSKKLYNFNAKGYMIVAYKQIPARITTEKIDEMKKNSYRVSATYDGIDVDKNNLYLLLDDLKTREVIKLKQIL